MTSTKSQANSKHQAPNHGQFVICNLEFGYLRSGFTLLETIVALALIVSALTGPFALASRGIFGAKFSRSKIIALNLSQEGVELIRQMRENNVLSGAQWRGLSGTCGARCTRLQDGSYQPDVYTSASGSTPPLSSNAPLLFDETSGLYSQTSGTATLFTRVVDISTPSADQMRVLSTVNWIESGIPRRIQLEVALYNWQ